MGLGRMRLSSRMLCLALFVVYGIATSVAAPYSFEPDYAAAILSLRELNPSQNPETVAQRQRKEEQQERLEGIRRQILEMLNLPCVPRPPMASSITSDNMRLFNQLLVRLQNQTGPEREGLLKRAQSFYPACEPPEETEQLYGRDQDAMNVYFNLSSFFLTLPSDVSIDVAELRLYNKLAPPSPLSLFLMPDAWEEENDKIRVSIYMYSADTDSEYGVNDTELVDSVVVSKYGNNWVKLNVRSAVRLWSGELPNLGLSVTVEDVRGNPLKPQHFFENMDCNGTTPGSPMPGYLLQVAREQQIPVHQQYHYPVLDLRTAEDADLMPLNGAVPSTAPCPHTPQPYNQPLYATLPNADPENGMAERPQRRHRRRHNRRQHHRRGSGGARRHRRNRGRH